MLEVFRKAQAIKIGQLGVGTTPLEELEPVIPYIEVYEITNFPSSEIVYMEWRGKTGDFHEVMFTEENLDNAIRGPEPSSFVLSDNEGETLFITFFSLTKLNTNNIEGL